ncbi:metalloregulator ArsR/SmtB family transcription factor [Phycicoccus sp. M110.8]|uniref:ArsR/SmtB family transcription factor n=1 Tax=Phycicoccus sp. M110.8 TaxID=3075433 RepID=UPI0028FD95C9|nr:metalloregulator ArsR/SmtB family transcription factor [Phycicoccus sp. M110.8]MDU0312225.1 metalloregulator ArsR/SmtB family transcription factor [Phycicoccus sp. M110.8]
MIADEVGMLSDRIAGDPWAALGDPSRRRILRLLATRPASVAELAEGLPISRPAVSQHLKVLKDSGLVVVQPQGTRRIYRVDPAGLAALRAELDSFWGTALANFAQLAERHSTTTDPSSKETSR